MISKLKSFFSTKVLIFAVFAFFVAVQLPYLGHDSFNTDVWKWKARTYDFGSGVFGLDFEKTIQKYHPGVTLMWLGVIGVKLQTIYYAFVLRSEPVDNLVSTVFELHFLQKLVVVLAIAAALALIFRLLARNFGRLFGLIFITLLVGEPFYLGLTREFHLEGLMSTFMVLSALFLFDYLKFKGKSLWLSGIFAGLAILTKTSAIFMIPFCVSVLWAVEFVSLGPATFLKSALVKSAKWFLTVFGTFTVLWPAMWVAPAQVFQVIFRGIFVIGVENDHIQYYFGKLVDSPGPEYYLVVLALRSTPFLLAGLITLIGYLVAVKIRKLPPMEAKFKQLVVFLTYFSICYLLQITIPSKKLDRYVLPALMTLTMLSAVGIYHLVTAAKKPLKNFGLGLLTASVVFSAYTSISIIPDYLSYYNPLFGGLKTGITILEPKWLIGAREIQTELSSLVSQNPTIQPAPDDQSIEELIQLKTIENYMVVAFPEKYYTQVWPFVREQKFWPVIEDMTSLSKYAKYFVFPVWQDDAALDPTYSKVSEIKVRGVTIYKVYEKNN